MPDGLLTIATPEQVRAVAVTRGADGLRRAVRGQCAPCCGPCTSLWRLKPCSPGSAFCPPTVCDLYLCVASNPCAPGGFGVGSVVQFGGVCYAAIGEVPAAPPGALVLGAADFSSGRAHCLPGADCGHPACLCNPGTYLYWSGCPCPGGAGDGVCRVISLADYTALAQSLGSECVVANAGGLRGCHYVSLYSPRADALPPGCVVYAPGTGEVTDSCCECCPGCGSTRITSAQCAGVQSLNPKWACAPGVCCCQRVRYVWSYRQLYSPPFADNYINVFHSGDETVDFPSSPSGVVVPVAVTIEAWSGTEVVQRSMTLHCGAHTVLPAGTEFLPVQFPNVYNPQPDGDLGGGATLQQTGVYSCNAYRATAAGVIDLGHPKKGVLSFEWKIDMIPMGSSGGTCGRGCAGRAVVVRPGPCAAAGGGVQIPGGDGLVLPGALGSGCAGCGGNPFSLPSRAELEAM